MKFTLGFSPCPNDTFIFDALVNHKIETQGLNFDVVLEDVQTLNSWALKEKLDISKISYAVLPLVLSKYNVLTAGGALGKGVGPLLIKRKDREDLDDSFDPDRMTVAIPGKHTTAHMLFSMAFPSAVKKQFMLFSEIENAVLNRKVDAGVIIHENRFTYMDRGLQKMLDLGEYWEEKTKSPIPLGGIVINKKIPPDLALTINALIKKSVEYSFEHYPEVSAYVKQHSQEMEPDIMRKHIDLYVNHYSLSLEDEGKKAVMKMLQVMHAEELPANTHQDIFVG